MDLAAVTTPAMLTATVIYVLGTHRVPRKGVNCEGEAQLLLSVRDKLKPHSKFRQDG